MSISIIIPTLNEALELPKTLSVLQALRGNDVEIIVVDGGSGDKTLQLAKQYADCVISSEKGRAKQMNRGAEAAMGDVLLFLHADTTLSPDAYSSLIEIDEVLPYWGRFNVRLDGSQFIFRIIEKMMNTRSCFTSIATGDHAMFVSKELFVQVGGYPEIDLMEDIAISKKLKQKAPLICISESVVTSSRRWQKKGVIRTVLFMWCLRLAYLLNRNSSVLAKLYSQSQ